MDYDKPKWIMTNQNGFQQFQMESNNVRWIPKIQNGLSQFKKRKNNSNNSNYIPRSQAEFYRYKLQELI